MSAMLGGGVPVKENEFRYMVLQSLIVLANQVHRMHRNLTVQRLLSLDCDSEMKDLEDLVSRLEVAKEEAMK